MKKNNSKENFLEKVPVRKNGIGWSQGATENGANIFPLCELEAYCKRENVKIGIITVPKNAAQDICDRLVGCGVNAIWNFAPCNLSIPDNVILQNENLALSLAHLKLQMDCK